MTEWKIEEQEFGGEYGVGRLVIDLADGVSLSIITPERNNYIREQKRWSASATLHGWSYTDVQASPGTYEVAALRSDGAYDSSGLDPEPPGWWPHRKDDEEGVIYGSMPPALINAYVNRVGLRHADAE